MHFLIGNGILVTNASPRPVPCHLHASNSQLVQIQEIQANVRLSKKVFLRRDGGKVQIVYKR